MTLHEAILAAIDKLDETFNQQGVWSAEDYMTMIAPLHQALLTLAQKEPCNDDKLRVTDH